MKVVLPSETTHTIQLIPRFDPYTLLVLSLFKEATRVTTTPVNTYYMQNGYLYITFDGTFIEGEKYQIKIASGTDIVWRGKLLCTSQVSQQYKLTNDLYFYE
jgi:hypothetical protein